MVESNVAAWGPQTNQRQISILSTLPPARTVAILPHFFFFAHLKKIPQEVLCILYICPRELPRSPWALSAEHKGPATCSQELTDVFCPDFCRCVTTQYLLWTLLPLRLLTKHLVLGYMCSGAALNLALRGGVGQGSQIHLEGLDVSVSKFSRLGDFCSSRSTLGNGAQAYTQSSVIIPRQCLHTGQT